MSGSSMHSRLTGNKNTDVSTFELQNSNLVIHMGMELDHHSAKYVKEYSDKLIDKGDIKNIVFDFNGVSFMDSSGIGMIMGRYKKLIYMGGKVSVVGVGSSVDRIFLMSGLYKIVKKYKTVQLALQSM